MSQTLVKDRVHISTSSNTREVVHADLSPFGIHNGCGTNCRKFMYDAVIYHAEKDSKVAFVIKEELGKKVNVVHGETRHSLRLELLQNLHTAPYMKGLEKFSEVTPNIILLITKNSLNDPLIKDGNFAIWAQRADKGFEIIPLLYGFGENEDPPSDFSVLNAHFVRYAPNEPYFIDTMMRRLFKFLHERLQHDDHRENCLKQRPRAHYGMPTDFGYPHPSPLQKPQDATRVSERRLKKKAVSPGTDSGYAEGMPVAKAAPLPSSESNKVASVIQRYVIPSLEQPDHFQRHRRQGDRIERGQGERVESGTAGTGRVDEQSNGLTHASKAARQPTLSVNDPPLVETSSRAERSGTSADVLQGAGAQLPQHSLAEREDANSLPSEVVNDASLIYGRGAFVDTRSKENSKEEAKSNAAGNQHTPEDGTVAGKNASAAGTGTDQKITVGKCEAGVPSSIQTENGLDLTKELSSRNLSSGAVGLSVERDDARANVTAATTEKKVPAAKKQEDASLIVSTSKDVKQKTKAGDQKSHVGELKSAANDQKSQEDDQRSLAVDQGTKTNNLEPDVIGKKPHRNDERVEGYQQTSGHNGEGSKVANGATAPGHWTGKATDESAGSTAHIDGKGFVEEEIEVKFKPETPFRNLERHVGAGSPGHETNCAASTSTKCGEDDKDSDAQSKHEPVSQDIDTDAEAQWEKMPERKYDENVKQKPVDGRGKTMPKMVDKEDSETRLAGGVLSDTQFHEESVPKPMLASTSAFHATVADTEEKLAMQETLQDDKDKLPMQETVQDDKDKLPVQETLQDVKGKKDVEFCVNESPDFGFCEQQIPFMDDPTPSSSNSNLNAAKKDGKDKASDKTREASSKQPEASFLPTKPENSSTNQTEINDGKFRFGAAETVVFGPCTINQTTVVTSAPLTSVTAGRQSNDSLLIPPELPTAPVLGDDNGDDDWKKENEHTAKKLLR